MKNVSLKIAIIDIQAKQKSFLSMTFSSEAIKPLRCLNLHKIPLKKADKNDYQPIKKRW